MPKKDKAPMEKVTIRLFEGDKETLSELFPNLSYNQVIRVMVRNLIKKTASRAAGNEPTAHVQLDVDFSKGE